MRTRPKALLATLAVALFAASLLLIPAAGSANIGLRMSSEANPTAGLKSGTQTRARVGRPGQALVNASFERGLNGWNTAGVGDVVPSVVSDVVRSGSHSARVVLSGRQERSELGLGGVGDDSPSGIVFEEGDEYWYGFSINVREMVYGGPGAHNLIMQFKSYGEGSPNFGLQLWDYEGDGVSGGKGLWSHSGAMDGDRFLSPLSEDEWHDIAIHFRASSVDDGFYEIYLDGELIDARSGVSMIVPGESQAYIKTGLYRNPDTLPGTSELRLDAAKLGASFAAVSPR